MFRHNSEYERGSSWSSLCLGGMFLVGLFFVVIHNWETIKSGGEKDKIWELNPGPDTTPPTVTRKVPVDFDFDVGLGVADPDKNPVEPTDEEGFADADPKAEAIAKEEFDSEVKRRKKEMEDNKPYAIIHHGGNAVERLAFSPDGKTIAAMNTKIGDGGGLRLYDVATGKLIRVFDHYALNGGLCFSPDGKHIAAGAWVSRLKIFETATGKLVFGAEEVFSNLPITSCFWTGDYLAVAEMRASVAVFKFPEMKEIFREKDAVYGPEILDLQVKDGVPTLLLNGLDVIRLQGDKKEVVYKIGGRATGGLVDYCPQTKEEIWSDFNDRTVSIKKEGKTVVSFERPDSWGKRKEVHRAKFSQDGKYFVYGGNCGAFYLYTSNNGKEVFRGRYCIGPMQNEAKDEYGAELKSFDIFVNGDTVTIAVGGNLVKDEVKLYKTKVSK